MYILAIFIKKSCILNNILHTKKFIQKDIEVFQNMNIKKTLLVFCLIMCILFTISSVAAGDVNDGDVISKDANQKELSSNNGMVEDNLQTSDENTALEQSNDYLSASAETDSKIVFIPVPNNKFLPPTLRDVNLAKEISPAVILFALIQCLTAAYNASSLILFAVYPSLTYK